MGTQQAMAEPAPAPPRRRSRLGLYGPPGLLAALVLAWAIGWVVVRESTRRGFEGWLEAEAAAGRRWTCADRAIGGFPFRIELSCASASVERPDVRASIGKLLVVNQVYRPRHVIAEASGPLRLEAGDIRVDGKWRLLQASVVSGEVGPERASLALDEPSATISGPGLQPFDTSSKRFEAHLRPEPNKPETVDLAVRVDALALPALDVLIGGKEPANVTLSAALTEAVDLKARPLPEELERWRNDGGRLLVSGFTVAKGAARAEARGTFGIDEQHRPEGQLDLSAADLGGLLGQVTTGAGGLNGALLGALLGGAARAPKPGEATGPGGLKPLPPLRLQGGRLLLGPLALPGIRVPRLY